jgi:hypothetical protein
MSVTQKTVWFGMKVTPEQKEKIRKLAHRRGVSQKRAVMDLIEEATKELAKKASKGSFLDGIEHLSGSVHGPGDLSTNPKYMEGFGR